MRRYFNIICSALLIVGIILAVIFFTMKKGEQTTQKFIPATKILTVYTTLPPEMAQLISNAYLDKEHVQINFVIVSNDELTNKLQSPSNFNSADLLIADSKILQKFAKAGLLNNVFTEQEDIVQPPFKDVNSKWVGIWYDPIVFCYNKTYVKNNWYLPLSWQNLGIPNNNIRIAMTDFVGSSAAANILYSLSEAKGNELAMQLLTDISHHTTRYAKYLSTPVRMAGMGEVDVAIAVQSEALRYLNAQYPLTIVYPEDGSPYLLTGVGIFKNSSQREAADKFVNYLLGDEVQLVLQSSAYFYMPTNRETIAYKSFSVDAIPLLHPKYNLTSQQRQKLLDEWISTVRFTK